MYYIVVSLVILLLGAFMTIAPSKTVKKEFKDSEDHLKKARRNGIIILVLGIVLLILSLLML